jgi:hypothetical protein
VSLDTARPIVLHAAMRLIPLAAWCDGAPVVATGARRPRAQGLRLTPNPIGLANRTMTALRIDLDRLDPAERRDLANALLQAAWRAALDEVRILLLEILTEVDDVPLSDLR